jgi:hypothetical protein
MSKKLCTMNAQGEFLARKVNFFRAQMRVQMKNLFIHFVEFDAE